MGFDFRLDDRTEQWRGRIEEFVRDVVIPREQWAFAVGVSHELRRELQALARVPGSGRRRRPSSSAAADSGSIRSPCC